MGEKERKEKDKEEVGAHAPDDFLKLCRCMMTAAPPEGAGSQVQEMVSRCMAYFRGEQKGPRQTGAEGGGDEEKRRAG